MDVLIRIIKIANKGTKEIFKEHPEYAYHLAYINKEKLRAKGVIASRTQQLMLARELMLTQELTVADANIKVNLYHELKLGGDARLPATRPKQLGQSLQSRRGRSPPKEQPARAADEGAKMTVEEYDEIERLRKAQQSGQRNKSPSHTKQHTESQPLKKSLEQGFGAKAGTGNL